MNFWNRQRPTLPQPPAGLPRQEWWIIGLALALSFAWHVGSLSELSRLASALRLTPPSPTASVKFRVLDNATARAMKQRARPPRIVEAPQRPTEAPDHADFLGAVNHKTARETRKANVVPSLPGADPTAPQNASRSAQSGASGQPRLGFIKSPTGTIAAARAKARDNLDALVPTAGELANQVNRGYQDYIDSDVDEGDRVDVNTTEYRYMGYMTHLRKAIELVWNYPVDAARRGFQGVGTCHFTIGRDGRVRQVRIASSTGYDVLDRAFLEAVRVAAIPPLPPSISRENFPVSFDYRYILSPWAAH